MAAVSTMMTPTGEWGYGRVLEHDYEIIYWYEGIKRRAKAEQIWEYYDPDRKEGSRPQARPRSYCNADHQAAFFPRRILSFSVTMQEVQ
jgi:hypothetical protein